MEHAHPQSLEQKVATLEQMVNAHPGVVIARHRGLGNIGISYPLPSDSLGANRVITITPIKDDEHPGGYHLFIMVKDRMKEKKVTEVGGFRLEEDIWQSRLQMVVKKSDSDEIVAIPEEDPSSIVDIREILELGVYGIQAFTLHEDIEGPHGENQDMVSQFHPTHRPTRDGIQDDVQHLYNDLEDDVNNRYKIMLGIIGRNAATIQILPPQDLE